MKTRRRFQHPLPAWVDDIDSPEWQAVLSDPRWAELIRDLQRLADAAEATDEQDVAA